MQSSNTDVPTLAASLTPPTAARLDVRISVEALVSSGSPAMFQLPSGTAASAGVGIAVDASVLPTLSASLL